MLFAISCSAVLHSWSQQQQPGVADKHKGGLLSPGLRSIRRSHFTWEQNWRPHVPVMGLRCSRQVRALTLAFLSA